MKIKDDKLLVSMLVLAVLHPVFNYSFRLDHVFVDYRIFWGFSAILLFLMLLNAYLWLGLLKFKDSPRLDDKKYKIIFFTGIALHVLFSIINLAYIFAGMGNLHIYYFYFKPIFFYTLVGLGGYFIIFILPRFKGFLRKALSVSLALIIGLSVIFKAFDVAIFKFETDPVVFIADDSYYSLVWATNKNSTGAVSYTYEGQDYLVYDSMSGNIRSNSRIHAVKIPRDHLDGNSYKVISARVYDHLGYSARIGRAKHSKEFEFKKYKEGQDIVALSFSDWHDSKRMPFAVAKHMQEPDIFYMVGDALNMINSEDNVIDYLLKICAHITKSACPTVFVRGNHEARGAYAINLQDYIGLDKYYYTYTWGPISGVVFDSGEDKPDDHPEYSGLVNFEPYKAEQDLWFADLKRPKRNAYFIAACHDPNIPEEWARKLSRLNTSFMLSGHWHMFDFREADPKEGRRFPIIVDGGKKDSSYIATELVLSGKDISIRAFNPKGDLHYEDAFKIK